MFPPPQKLLFYNTATLCRVAVTGRLAEMSSGSLFLHPVDAETACPRDRLAETLAGAGMLGAPYDGRENAFLVGERFLQLVTFMGCSPHIELDPPGGNSDDFCHVLIHTYAVPRLMVGSNTRAPRCPVCGKPGAVAAAALARRDPALPVPCDHCGTRNPVASLKWRRDAGFGRLFVEVRSVFPGEAVPVEGLFRTLAETTGGPWNYFYLTDASGSEVEPLG